MRSGRRLFRNTPVQRMPFVNSVYQKLSAAAYGESGTVVVRFRDVEIEVTAGDITTLPSLADGTYESAELDEFLGELSPGATVVDIGANIGIWSVLISRAIGPDGAVFAFEPSPTNAHLLRSNLERNSCSNVEVIDAAVGRRSGSGRLDTSSAGATHSMSVHPSDEDTEVEVVSLDEFLSERRIDRVAAIKIDVEGFEPESIAGMADVLERCPVFLTELSIPQSLRAGTDWRPALQLLAGVYDGCQVFDGRTTQWVPSSELLALMSSRKLLNLLFTDRTTARA